MRYAIRQMRRSKLFSSIVILLLAVGIGANTLIFSFVNELLLKPLPVRQPENLYLLETNRQKQVRPDTTFSYRAWLTLRDQRNFFDSVLAVAEIYHPIWPLDIGGGTRLATVEADSGNFFAGLGIQPALGRLFGEDDANATGYLPAVVSYEFWQSQFGGRPDALGQIIRLKAHPFTIVGVMPHEFHGFRTDRSPDVRLPLSAIPILVDQPLDASPSRAGYELILRLRSGVTPQQAIDGIAGPLRAAMEKGFPYWDAPSSPAALRELLNFKIAFHPLRNGLSQLRDQFSRALVLLLGSVALLLLIVCINVAGLLLARAESRRKEIAVRLAIGAPLRRLLRQLLTETFLLTATGSIAGAVFAYASAPLLVRMLPPYRDLGQVVTPLLLTVRPDWRVFAFLSALSLLAVMLAGLAPAWIATRIDLNTALKSPAQTRTGAGHLPWSAALVAAQVTLGTILVMAAGLLVRSFWNLNHLNPGFDRAHVLLVEIDPGDAGYENQQRETFYRELLTQVQALPGVRAAGYGGRGLMRGVGIKATIAPAGVQLPASTFLNTSLNSVTAEYFQSLGIPILAGRTFQPSDARTGARPPFPITINKALAEAFYPGQNPLGRMLVLGADGRKRPNWVIVGVVGTAKYRSLREPAPPTFYSQLHYTEETQLILHVRTFTDPAPLAGAVRRIIRQIGPSVPIVEVSTLEQEVETSLWQERLVAVLSLFFGCTALLLAGAGLYGALAYSVTRRTRELGIRIALGARVNHILQAVCSRTGLAVCIGLSLGLAASAFLGRLAQHLLYGVQPVDAPSLAAAAIFVLLGAATAAAIPSRRALKIDPSSALREE